MSARRSTRARSGVSSPPKPPDDGQAPRAGVRRRRNAETYAEPPSADLPGLFPVHDGSYGVNTLVNVDAVSTRGRRLRPAGVAQEEEEDARFRRRLRGRVDKDARRLVIGTAVKAEAAVAGGWRRDEFG